jgi:anti-sigma-K factor RskA
MCFGKGGGPTQAENKAAAEQKVEAEAELQKAVQERAKQKAEDIDRAISASTVNEARRGRSGGSGRRSLFQSAAGGAGFLNRFNR